MNLTYNQGTETLKPYAEQAIQLFRQFHGRQIVDRAVTFSIVPDGGLVHGHLRHGAEVRKTSVGYDILIEQAVVGYVDVPLVGHELMHVDTTHILEDAGLHQDWYKILDEGRSTLFEAYIGHVLARDDFATHVRGLREKRKEYADDLEEITNAAKALMEVISPDVVIDVPRMFPLHGYWFGLVICHAL